MQLNMVVAVGSLGALPTHAHRAVLCFNHQCINTRPLSPQRLYRFHTHTEYSHVTLLQDNLHHYASRWRWSQIELVALPWRLSVRLLVVFSPDALVNVAHRQAPPPCRSLKALGV